MSKYEDGVPQDEERPIVTHLLELRDRLLRIMIALTVVFLGLLPFANTLYTWLSGPLQAVLPEGASMVAIQVAAPFIVPMKTALLAALFVCVPYILYQLWAFVAPGLYRHERQLVWPLLISSTLLFYLGAAFAYVVVFPLVFGFFANVTPTGVTMMTDINEYLSFILKLFFAFGAAFEVPVATILVLKTGLTTREALVAKRPYIIVGAFVLGMLLTPPDVLSQILLAIPIWFLFELGLLMSGWFGAPAEAAPESEDTGSSST